MITIDEKFHKVNAYTRGRKEKIWFVNTMNNKKYLYKFGASNYEIYAEVIAEQLGIQAGISMANYRIAKYKNTVGVLSKNFIKPEELIISADKLKRAVQFIYEENNLDGNLKSNTISNLIEAAFTYDPSIDTKELFDELVKRWMFYGLIMESDKNDTNISFIKKKRKLKLSPDYDNSTMARLNENVAELLKGAKESPDFYRLTDSIKQSLTLCEGSSDYFLESFYEFNSKYHDKAVQILKTFKSVDVDEAILKVERLNKISVPWKVSYFLNKTISNRYSDMEDIVVKQIKYKLK